MVLRHQDAMVETTLLRDGKIQGTRPAHSGPHGKSELCERLQSRSIAPGLYRSLRCPVLSGSPLPTRTQRQVRQYGGGLLDFPRRVQLTTVLGGFYWSAPRKSWCSFPMVVLAQRTVVVPQTGFSNKVVYVRVVQQRLKRSGFGLWAWQQITGFFTIQWLPRGMTL